MPTTLARHLRRNLVAYIALFFGLAGTSFGATTKLLPANSVGTKQVINGSLLKKDFKRGQLARGPQGPQGPQGIQGPPGAQGAQGLPGANGATNVVIRLGPLAKVSGQYLVSGALCHPGERATGGGYYFQGLDQPDDVVQLNRPDPTAAAPTEGSVPTLWAVQIYDVNADDGPAGTTLQAYVICAAP